jgi:hypothetical protein
VASGAKWDRQLHTTCGLTPETIDPNCQLQHIYFEKEVLVMSISEGCIQVNEDEVELIEGC